MFRPHTEKFGGFSQNDGTIDFYHRVGMLADPVGTYLDFGAGRGEWFEDDPIAFRRNTRHMRGRFAQTIATDLDSVVLKNRAVDHCVLIENGRVPLADASVDVIVADYVIEHVADTAAFAAEVSRLLRPGGWFCARTPHRLHYVALADRVIPDRLAGRVLHRAQPGRKAEDVFPKIYRLNTMRDISRAFPGWLDKSYCYRTEPAYYFGSRAIFHVADFMHRLLPKALSGNLFVFLQKSQA